MEFIKAGGSYAIVFGKSYKLLLRKLWNRYRSCICSFKEVSVEGQGLTAVEKYSIKMQLVLLR
jgi:aconitase B